MRKSAVRTTVRESSLKKDIDKARDEIKSLENKFISKNKEALEKLFGAKKPQNKKGSPS